MKSKASLLILIIIILAAAFYFQSQLSQKAVDNKAVDNNVETRQNAVSELKAIPAITSVACEIESVEKVTETYSRTFISLDANGTVVGPVGTKLSVGFTSVGVSSTMPVQASLSCGSWSKQEEYGGSRDVDKCLRKEGQPETANWSVKWSHRVQHETRAPLLMVDASKPGSSYQQFQQEVLCK